MISQEVTLPRAEEIVASPYFQAQKPAQSTKALAIDEDSKSQKTEDAISYNPKVEMLASEFNQSSHQASVVDPPQVKQVAHKSSRNLLNDSKLSSAYKARLALEQATLYERKV